MTTGGVVSLGWVVWPALAMTACGLAIFLLVGRISGRTLGALGLLSVLGGFFVLFVLLAPPGGPHAEWRAVLVFAATGAVFKLMSRFEAPQ